jgi:hypothetical protein
MIKYELGEDASSIIEEILLHGYLEMSSIVLKRLIIMYTQLDKTSIDKIAFEKNYQSIKESFKNLINNDYIERLPQLESFYENNLAKNGLSNGNHTENGENKSKVPKFIKNDIDAKDLPELKIDCN